MKRIVLFLITNLAVFALLAVIARALGLDAALARQGLNMRGLLVMAAIIGFAEVMIGERFGVEPLDPDAAEAAIRADWEQGTARGVQGSPHFFVGERGWFCPSLEISHTGPRFDIKVAGETMREFYAAVFE